MTIFYFVLGNLPAIFQLTFPSTIDKKTLAFKEQRSLQRAETYRRIPVTLDAKEIEFENYGGKTEEIVSRDNTRSGIQNPIESSQFVERSRSLSVLFLFFFFSLSPKSIASEYRADDTFFEIPRRRAYRILRRRNSRAKLSRREFQPKIQELRIPVYAMLPV